MYFYHLLIFLLVFPLFNIFTYLSVIFFALFHVSSGHFSLTREIGSFSNIQMNNSSGDQLDEHDANSSVVEEEEPDRGAVNDDTENKDTEVDLLENQEPSDPDEDFRIDEFDD